MAKPSHTFVLTLSRRFLIDQNDLRGGIIIITHNLFYKHVTNNFTHNLAALQKQISPLEY